MICKQMLLITVSNEPGLIFCTHLNGFKQELPFNTNYSIQHNTFVCTKLNDSTYH